MTERNVKNLATPNHTQLKFKCLQCSLHFVVCTWYPERHGVMAVYCPECGQHEGAFIMWAEPSQDFIFQVVPGNAQFAAMYNPPRDKDGNIISKEK